MAAKKAAKRAVARKVARKAAKKGASKSPVRRPVVSSRKERALGELPSDVLELSAKLRPLW
jgi:hypothetical protein